MNQNLVINKNTTLYAHWEKLKYVLDINPDYNLYGTGFDYWGPTKGKKSRIDSFDLIIYDENNNEIYNKKGIDDFYDSEKTYSGYGHTYYIYNIKYSTGYKHKNYTVGYSIEDKVSKTYLIMETPTDTSIKVKHLYEGNLYISINTQPINYKVDLDRQGGTGGNDSVDVTKDEAIPQINVPTKIGYTFQGYYDAKDGGTKYINENGSSAKNWDKTGNATLYAHWKANIQVGTYGAGGGYARLDYNGYKVVLGVNPSTNQAIGGWVSIAGDFKKGQEVVLNVDFVRSESGYWHWDLNTENGDNSSYNYNVYSYYKEMGYKPGWGYLGSTSSFSLSKDWEKIHQLKFKFSKDTSRIYLSFGKSTSSERNTGSMSIKSIYVGGNKIL